MGGSGGGLGDNRILPEEQLGDRRFRTWASLVTVVSTLMTMIPDFTAHFSGPPVFGDLVRQWAARGGVLAHVRDFFRESGMPPGSAHRHEFINHAIAIELALTADQMNPLALLHLEVLGRRLALLEYAYEHAPRGGAPDFSMGAEWMGLREMRIGAAVDPASLKEHVADRLGKKAAILKEARKAQEELRQRKRGGGKGGGGGEGGAAGADAPGGGH